VAQFVGRKYILLVAIRIKPTNNRHSKIAAVVRRRRRRRRRSSLIIAYERTT